MHKVLQRRIAKLLGGQVPPGFEAFMQAISEDYLQADRDRHLLERSLELSSKEMLGANERLRTDLRVQDLQAAALAQQQREFRELIELLPLALVVRHGNEVKFANAAFARALGRENQTLRHAAFVDLLHPEERALAMQRIAHFESSGQVDPRGETRWLKPDGETVFLELEFAREIRFEGASALLLALRDVTELKNLHMRLSVADRMASVGTMAAGVAHEINNPLSFIIANLEYISRGLRLPSGAGAEPEELRAATAEAIDGANRVKEIVRDLKTFTRSTEAEPSACNVAEVVDGAIKLASNAIRHVARLERRYQPVSAVRANAGRLGQVVLNLLVNASQAIPAGAAEENCITVSLSQQQAHVCIEVRDTGEGMTNEQVGRIFDPFFTTKPAGVGTGLGLSICHSIVQQLGGVIEVETERGKGSAFRVSLPAYEGEATQASTAHASGLVRQERLRVLVIDDDELVGRGISRMLGTRHQVERETSPQAALRRLKADPKAFDAVLCDVMMPELSAADLYERLMRVNPGLADRVIFMTGGANMPAARHFLEQTKAPWLEKPFDRQEVEVLLEAVRKLGKHR